MGATLLAKTGLMDIYEFGEALIETKDLDPVYVALNGAKLPEDQLKRFLMASMCFYHVGVASYMSEFKDEGSYDSRPNYWQQMYVAAVNEQPAPNGGRWPREPERRHFRGQTAIKAVEFLSKKTPEERVEALYDVPRPEGASVTLEAVMSRVKQYPFFGPWAQFKFADLIDATGLAKVHFPDEVARFYDSPRKTLELLAAEQKKHPDDIFYELKTHFEKIECPHAARKCRVQEIETILCKFGSYRKGKYRVGKDCHEVRDRLQGWGATAERLLAAVPDEVRS